MKNFAWVLGLCLALLWSAPAPAADAPVDPATQAKVDLKAKAYQGYASSLGYTEFATGKIIGSMYSLQYLQPGETMATAKSVVKITVYGLSGDREKDNPKMASTVAMLQGLYIKSATMVDDKVMPNPLDEKTWFTQFYYGPENGVTYVAGSFIRTNTKPSEAAFIQLQSRSIIPPEKALILYQLVNSQAVLPPKKKKGFDPQAPLTPEPESIAK